MTNKEILAKQHAIIHRILGELEEVFEVFNKNPDILDEYEYGEITSGLSDAILDVYTVDNRLRGEW